MENYNDDLFDAVQSGEITKDAAIEVNVFAGPIGSCGFRSGEWLVKIGGCKFKMYSSIPHQLSLADQEDRLLSSARSRLARAITAETYVTDAGKTELRYASQMRRVK